MSFEGKKEIIEGGEKRSTHAQKRTRAPSNKKVIKNNRHDKWYAQQYGHEAHAFVAVVDAVLLSPKNEI